MGKSTLVASFFLLLLVSAANAAGNPSAGLEAACKKTPEPDFCELLLQPSAGEFVDGDPKKMEGAVLSAAIDKVKDASIYIEKKASKNANNKELQESIQLCTERISSSLATLSNAKDKLTEPEDANAPPRKLGNVIPIKLIQISSDSLASCQSALRESEAAAMAAGGQNVDITREGLLMMDESIRACAIAKAIVPPS